MDDTDHTGIIIRPHFTARIETTVEQARGEVDRSVSAEILMFTGVRYEREVEKPAPKPARKAKAKRHSLT